MNKTEGDVISIKILIKKVLVVIIFCAMLMAQAFSFSKTDNRFLTVKLSDYKIYIESVQLPVYRVNGNLMINITHLNYYGFTVKSNENRVLCYRDLSKQITGVPQSKWNEKYNIVTIKPKNWCFLNGKQIPVLYLNNQPFVFLNGLYEDNSVKISGKRVDITIGIVDEFEKIKKALNKGTS